MTSETVAAVGDPRSGRVIGKGRPEEVLSDSEIRLMAADALAREPVDGKRVLVVIPDGTRTMPMPLMFDLIEGLLRPRCSALDYLVALGTHQPLTDAQLSRLVGRPVIDGRAGPARVSNHQWDRPETCVRLGTIPGREVDALTGGLLVNDVDVSLNRLVLDYDRLVICGPVFPHEVAGFSGGMKYLFPGIAGPEIIDFTHWLGALITSAELIGNSRTPVRAVIHRAAAFVDRPLLCFCLVVTEQGVAGFYAGEPHAAWEAAAELSRRVHIVYVDRPFRRVLSIMPEMYEDLWTAAKGMYKLEPAMADGGEIVIFAPHISEISRTHGALIDEVGYHCRDYFLAQWDRFKRYPGGVLAHATHVKGAGRYDPETKTETARITVTLATRIPAERCRRVNLNYLDPDSVVLADWQEREQDGVLVVPRAGELLYRLDGTNRRSEA